MEEQVKIKKKTSKGTKKTKSKFWFGYRIFVGVLALLFVVMCIAVWNTMKKYEAAQPEKYVEKSLPFSVLSIPGTPCHTLLLSAYHFNTFLSVSSETATFFKAAPTEKLMISPPVRN